MLSTRPLAQALIDNAAKKYILVDCISFIETKPLQDEHVLLSADKYGINTAVIFTSMNAVEFLANAIDTTDIRWRIACIGEATLQLVQNKFPKSTIIATADNARLLAQKIIALNSDKHIVFFCGDKRREELPAMLRASNIEVEEVVIYKTIETSVVIEKRYDAILFYSPSAVVSFFSANKIDTETVLFAIGETTANTIKDFSNNKIIISDSPGKEALLKLAVNSFAKK